MVLCGYTSIDGKGYFLVADPYVLQSRYKDWDQLRTTDTGNDGLIYATPEVLYRDMKSIILFEQDRNSFPLYCHTKTWEALSPRGVDTQERRRNRTPGRFLRRTSPISCWR